MGMEDKCEICEGQGFLICGNCDAYEQYDTEINQLCTDLRDAVDFLIYFARLNPQWEELRNLVDRHSIKALLKERP